MICPSGVTPGDEEARLADWVVTNSSFTTQSLVDAGVDSRKVLTVPLGGPGSDGRNRVADSSAGAASKIFVGPTSVRRCSLSSTRVATGRRRAPELHFYGEQLLPRTVVEEARTAKGGERIFFHGSVPSADLPAVYRGASVLVFPTLCDGFGMVASEALANGLPVITTRNAGAADAIEEGRSGFVIAPADEDALASSMQWCADHPRDLLAMRAAALSRPADGPGATFDRPFARGAQWSHARRDWSTRAQVERGKRVAH
jgi:glycosyltransferase involved in cell wall biosynthesis